MIDEFQIPDWVFQTVGVIVMIFGFGKIWGSLVQRDKAQEARILTLEVGIAQVEAEKINHMRDLQAMFVVEDGEPRYITYKAHDKMQEHCQKYILSELAHIKETCDEIKNRMNRRKTDMEDI